MTKILLAILALVPALAWAQKPTLSPADNTIAVHVQSSRSMDTCMGSPAGCFPAQHLTVLIEGKKYELEAKGSSGVLRVGDYKAKIVKDETKRSYEYDRAYEFLFADGTTRKYGVVGEVE